MDYVPALTLAGWMNLSCRYHLGFGKENNVTLCILLAKNIQIHEMLFCTALRHKGLCIKKWQKGTEYSQALLFFFALDHIQVGSKHDMNCF